MTIYILKTPGDAGDYLEVPDHDDLSVKKDANGNVIGLTVHAVMRPDVLSFRNLDGTYVRVLGKAASGNAEWHYVMHDKDSNGINSMRVYLYNLSGNLGSGSNFEDVWNTSDFVAVTYVIDPHNTYIYKNGILKRCDNWDGTNPPGCQPYYVVVSPGNGTATLRVGRDGYGAGFFEGSFRELKIFNRPLIPTEVAGLYSGTFTDTTNLMMFHNYRLGNAIDQSGRGHNGTLFGNAQFVADTCINPSCTFIAN